MQSRRQFLQTTVLGAGASLVPGALTAQSNGAFSFEPDGTVSIAGRPVPVDIALLGPNGEPTAGFYASLDPFHGQPFSQGWGTVYNYLLRNGPHSTNEEDIDRVITHVTIHGITRDDLDEVYQKAKKVWDANPELRENHGTTVHTHQEEAHEHHTHDHD